MTTPPRAVLYLRVSTVRQADHDVSLPDQRRQAEAWCAARGIEIVDVFVEAGASATNDRRPEFQRMIEAGAQKPPPFNMVVVHSFSRFFRDHFEFEFHVRKLGKNGVKLVSITQEIGDDPMHVMMRQIMSLFDEYQSKETAKHVLRAQKENARQGFWNGARPPIGYRAVDVEVRGAKVKKKLDIDPRHAETVRLVYRLYLRGSDEAGPMGVKAIVNHLNARSIRTRDGGRWGIAQVHRILTSRTYIGEHEFNVRNKDRKRNARDEVVTVQAPSIIQREIFDEVQQLLHARNPRVTPPRVVSGPTLLAGIIHCGRCGGSMTIRTGKGGRYRYYACGTRSRQGPTGCEGVSVRMEHFDQLIGSRLERRLLEADRLQPAIKRLLEDRRDAADQRDAESSELSRRAAEGDLRVRRLYEAIEAGVIDLHDSDLKERITSLKLARDQARREANEGRAKYAQVRAIKVTPQRVRAAVLAIRGQAGRRERWFRRDQLRGLVQRVEVADGEVRIVG